MRLVFCAICLITLSTPSFANGDAFRLNTQIEAFEWLSAKGEARVRYETLDGQFRADRSGSDQLLLFRSLLQVEADLGQTALGVEFQDSRTYLGDSGTPLSSSIANPLDILQAYVRFENQTGLLGPQSSSQTTLGRQTVSRAIGLVQ